MENTRRLCTTAVTLACTGLLTASAFADGKETGKVQGADNAFNRNSTVDRPIENRPGRPVRPNANPGNRGGGDTCATAVSIPSLPFSDTGSNAAATDDYNAVCPYTTAGGLDVVYSYTPGAAGFIDIDLCASAIDSKVYVYEGACVAGTEIACNDDSCGVDGYKSMLTGVPVLGGTTYYIVVDGYSATSTGGFSLNVTAGDPPPQCPAGSLFSQEPVLPADAWNFITSDTGPATPFLVQEDVQVGGNVNSIRFWGLQAFNGGAGFVSCEEVPMALQIIFYEDLGGAPGAVNCTYNVSLTPMPTGLLFAGFEMDTFETALAPACSVGNGWVSIQGTAVPTCWFLWAVQTPGGAGDSLQNGASTGENQAVCLSGTAIPGACCTESLGTCVENVTLQDCLATGGDRFLPGETCADFDPGCGQIPTGACCTPGNCEVITEGACLAAGGTYFGDNVSCATADCVPDNDLCVNAIPVVTGMSVVGDNTLAGDDVTGTCGTTSGIGELWYSVIGDGTTLTADTCNGVTDFDTKIQVFVNCASLTCVAGNDDSTTGAADCVIPSVSTFPRASSVSWCSEPGVTYLIAVSGFGTARGTFQLDVASDGFECMAPQGRCCFTEAVSCPGDIAGAMQGDNSPNGVVNLFDLLTLLSQWGGSGSGDIAGAMQNDGMPNGVVNLFDLLTLLANWGACPARGGGVQCVVNSNSECSDLGGAWTAGATCATPCPPDRCETAATINAVPFSASGTTVGAGDDYREDCGEGFTPVVGAPDLVYAFTPGSTVDVQISLCASTYDTIVYVFAGSCPNADLSGTSVACSDDNPAACGAGALQSQIDSVVLNAGTTYYIVVDGFSTSGNYDLQITTN